LRQRGIVVFVLHRFQLLPRQIDTIHLQERLKFHRRTFQLIRLMENAERGFVVGFVEKDATGHDEKRRVVSVDVAGDFLLQIRDDSGTIAGILKRIRRL